MSLTAIITPALLIELNSFSRMVCPIVGFSTTGHGAVSRVCTPPLPPCRQRSLLSELLRHDHLVMDDSDHLQEDYSEGDEYTDYGEDACDDDGEETDFSDTTDDPGSSRQASCDQNSGIYSTSQPIPIPYSR